MRRPRSRIDEAVVKGAEELLTQAGEIAVVHSQAEEETEMRQHIRFLTEEGYLRDDPKMVDLEDLPGVRGLKALRVAVNPGLPLWQGT